MFAQERFQSILSMLAQRQKMTVHELQNELEVSPATLRRDLSELEASGQVIRVRGAVVHPHYFRNEPTFQQKSREAAPAKRTIAQVAVSLVQPGSTVMIDAGSTCLEVGRLLLARPDLTLITHSLPLAMQPHTDATAKVVCIGGEVRAISGATVGGFALTWLEQLRADWCFVGTSGLSLENGLSTTELQETGMKQAMLRRCQQKVLVADRRKWEHPATIRFAGWDEVDFWVTDTPLKSTELQTLKHRGVEVMLCPQSKSGTE